MSFMFMPPIHPTIEVDDIESIDVPFSMPNGRTSAEYYSDEATGEVVTVLTGQQAANLIRDLIKLHFDMGMQSVYYKVPGEPELVDDLPADW